MLFKNFKGRILNYKNLKGKTKMTLCIVNGVGSI